MDQNKDNYTQYLSKWKGTWEFFTTVFGVKYEPGSFELGQLKKYKYQLRKVNLKQN